MEKELDPDIIKATQTSLGKYVKRPPLSEKLLRKPPFRFLHDIVTSVLKNTGFFEGLFEPEELISDNVKDREGKILFLNKVITVVGLATGKTLAIKPSKIVAGQEADKTNELLQCLASALDKKVSSDEAVKRYKENGASIQMGKDKKNKEIPNSIKEKEKKAEDAKKITSKSNEKLTTNKKDGKLTVKNISDGKNSNKVSQKDNTIKNESPPRKASQQIKKTSKKVIEKKEKEEVQDSQKNENFDKNANLKQNTDLLDDNLHERSDQKDSTLPSHSIGEKVLTNNASPLSIDNNQQHLEFTSRVDNQLNSSLSSQDLMEIDGESLPVLQGDSLGNLESESKINFSEKSDDRGLSNSVNSNNSVDKDENASPSDNGGDNHMSNSDAGKKLDNQNLTINKIDPNDVKYNEASEMEMVPKSPVRNNTHTMARPKSVRPSSSRPGAPRLRDKHDNILTENLIVGKVNIIAENTPIEEEEDSSMIILEQEKNSLPLNDEQEQFSVSSKPHGHLVQQILDSQKEFSQVAGKTEIEWEFGAQKAREAVNKEIEQLRYNIQGLSRVANPLGKILDHIQEDVEVMRQELQQWTTTYAEASKELLRQKTFNEDSLFPLRTKANQLEVDIKEKHEKINDLKVAIHKNTSRIEKLLASGDVQ